MENQNVIFFFSSSCFVLLLSGVQGSGGINGFHPKMLFVFGDSYVDTGNDNKSTETSWHTPYGITYPGQPAGRYSNGRVLTDFFARYFGLKSPVPYMLREEYPPKRWSYGMNFAFGGTGVFDTLGAGPNMTTQIDFFQNFVEQSVYTKSDLESSLGLVSVAGNDYYTQLAVNGSLKELPLFSANLSLQTAKNMKRIHDMGVPKVAVGRLQPLGCLPHFTQQTAFQKCNESFRDYVEYHNDLLKIVVDSLNDESKDSEPPFILLDLYGAFNTILNGSKGPEANFSLVLKPCCMPTQTGSYCGKVDDTGEKMYTVCDSPKASFFWDAYHPTQAGWRAVFHILKSVFGAS